MKGKISIFWYRRDLRLDDNVGFYHALQNGDPVLPIFIFDTEILENLPKNDARVTFFHGQLQKMRDELQNKYNSTIALFKGDVISVFEGLLREYDISSVYTNHDYEPYAIKRDLKIKSFLSQKGIGFHSFKDQVIFEKNEVVKDDGTPYLVYTPYKKKWKKKFNPSVHIQEYDTYSHFTKLCQETNFPNIQLSEIGFEPSTIRVENYKTTPKLIENYEDTRNFPALDEGTSRLGPHLRFGTVSIRKIVKKAISEKNEVFWSELIWREFFMQILWHFPNTLNNAFKPKYDRIVWRNDETEFELWKMGRTGYALVDAGMRELNNTGYMHNRVRMVVASFLCKHLLIDWRWGEAYFAKKLLDFELASNVGNWQWAAGSGVDAAPYFRVFNPMTQLAKFDSKGTYISKWITDYQELTYPSKIVDHKIARERCLKAYKEAVG
ncbi:deoxyribodipyrimidine photo-lyase [Flagellimonas hymeniacidonis]|uniref:Deoxyribodipyrimidine photo-lyase n=1 Tax=Flagellimonas hymeniacidonis TaxID=2603628 RepID=A0A5C8V4I9_9FLAO|nr:deoxyribodipyrimidine photo-lyase [Flagellimonas hymeniacidonis]TXN35925.1 deoxyribodipyrimidine photo-lyase [Flagellimonas hymeniacidonis]